MKGVTLKDSFPVSTIAHVTEGFTGGNMKEAISKVMTERRIMQAKERPFRVAEFIDPLANQPTTYL